MCRHFSDRITVYHYPHRGTFSCFIELSDNWLLGKTIKMISPNKYAIDISTMTNSCRQLLCVPCSVPLVYVFLSKPILSIKTSTLRSLENLLIDLFHFLKLGVGCNSGTNFLTKKINYFIFYRLHIETAFFLISKLSIRLPPTLSGTYHICR